MPPYRVALIGTGRVGYQFRFSDLPDNHAAAVQQKQDDQELRLQVLRAQTGAVVDQAKAISPHLVTALERLADEKLLSSLAGGFGEFAAAKGVGLLETARQFFDFLPDDKLRVLKHMGRNGSGLHQVSEEGAE